jgi:hypothetical protein
MWMLLWVPAVAAPPLTTIEDVLYKADGSKFNGVAFIEWTSFQAADFSNIATQSVTVQISEGALRVRLVPTTNAVPTAYYRVRYYSDGRIQFNEIWAVPPSDKTLRLRDVRVPSSSAAGEVVPPAGEQTQILESDVVGLLDDLEARPLKGPGFAPSRAAYINETGALDAVLGDLTDCVRVDGTAGPCDLVSGVGPGFVDAETPQGEINGYNTVFTLTQAPSPPSSLTLFRNGILQREGLDYIVTENVIEFAPASAPQPDDVLVCSYRLADAANPVSRAGGALTGTYPNPWIAEGVITDANISDAAAISEAKLALNFPTHTDVNDPTPAQKAALAGTAGAPSDTNRYVTDADPRLAGSYTAQVLCSQVGTSTSSTTSTSLGSCTLPAGSLEPGDRVEVLFSYSHEGATKAFIFELRWGVTSVVSRTTATGEVRVSGRAQFGVYATAGTQYDVQSWGASLSLASGTGNATDSISSDIVIDLRAQLSGTATDTVTLRNFTVIRYPAR